MGANSKIEWTDHTFNPWWGCVKVSQGCKNCYAETLSERFGEKIWGPNTARRMMSANYWNQPIKWNESARKEGIRRRVFCASMADVFEDHPGVVEERQRLFRLIYVTPHLDWLLLTKRPENMLDFTPRNFWEFPNVWAGTSVEDQAAADERIPHLLNVPAPVRFLSCEPLLGEVNLEKWLYNPCYDCEGYGNIRLPYSPFADSDVDTCMRCDGCGLSEDITDEIHWVIGGGESGAKARPMHPAWARSLRDQCKAAGVPFHFKQWGEYAPSAGEQGDGMFLGDAFYPHPSYETWQRGLERNAEFMRKVGKKRAGRVLDGREWNEFPEVNQ